MWKVKDSTHCGQCTCADGCTRAGIEDKHVFINLVSKEAFAFVHDIDGCGCMCEVEQESSIAGTTSCPYWVRCGEYGRLGESDKCNSPQCNQWAQVKKQVVEDEDILKIRKDIHDRSGGKNFRWCSDAC